MRYEVRLTKTEEKTIETFASSPQEAAQLCENEGFKAQEVTEMIGLNKVGNEYEVSGRCEICGEHLLDENYRIDCECNQFCDSCFEEWQRSEATEEESDEADLRAVYN